MDTKKVVLAVAVAAVLAALAASPVHAEVYASSLNVVLTNQTPYPVEPGSNVDVGVLLQNSGKDGAQNVYLVIDPSNPFELLPGQEAEKLFSQIPASESARSSYKLHVSTSAITSNYELKFRIYLGSTSNPFVTKTVNVNVQGVPDLVVTDITTSQIEPGSTASINVKVKNVGTGSARNVQVQFNSSVDEIKPVLSKGSVFVGDIAPGADKEVVFDASIDSSAEEKTYTVSLIAGYKNENNNAVTETFSVGIPVKGTVTLDIVKVEPLMDRDALRIELANKGTTSAKSIEASLVVDGKTVDVDYISELKSTKKTTMDFSPMPKAGGVGQLVINYVGPGLEKNKVVKEVSLAYQNGGGGDGTGTIIIVVIVIAVVAYYIWRRRRKASKHRKD